MLHTTRHWRQQPPQHPASGGATSTSTTASATGGSANVKTSGPGVAFSRSSTRMLAFGRRNPITSVFIGAGLIGSIFAYEVLVTNKNRVVSLTHDSQYEMDTSGEGNAAAKAKRVQAQRIATMRVGEVERASLQQLDEAASEAAKLRHAMELQASIDLSAASDAEREKNFAEKVAREKKNKAELPLAGSTIAADNWGPIKESTSTMYIAPGHVQVKEGTWHIRNMERNWSIMAQDLYKQKDNYAYRIERSRDDDFGRKAAKS